MAQGLGESAAFFEQLDSQILLISLAGIYRLCSVLVVERALSRPANCAGLEQLVRLGVGHFFVS